MKTTWVGIGLVFAFVALTGFKLDNAIVPQEEILAGGPPKNGIPAILKPHFIPPDKATYLQRTDQVIGVRIDSQARAYPLNILNWHEVVNDTINGKPIAVTF